MNEEPSTSELIDMFHVHDSIVTSMLEQMQLMKLKVEIADQISELIPSELPATETPEEKKIVETSAVSKEERDIKREEMLGHILKLCSLHSPLPSQTISVPTTSSFDVTQVAEYYERKMKAKDTLITLLSNSLRNVSNLLSESQASLDKVALEHNTSFSSMKSEVESLVDEVTVLRKTHEDMQKAVLSLRRENISLSARVAALSQENSELKVTQAESEAKEPSQARRETLEKIVVNQQHLISALKEEAITLMDALQMEKRNRKNFKSKRSS